MHAEPDPQAPWGRCPRCGSPLERRQLPLTARPGGVSMAGPPTCPRCTPEEIERYIEEWGAPADWEPPAEGDADAAEPPEDGADA